MLSIWVEFQVSLDHLPRFPGTTILASELHRERANLRLLAFVLSLFTVPDALSSETPRTAILFSGTLFDYTGASKGE